MNSKTDKHGSGLMRRSLLAAAIATALLTTQQVQALGLGEAEVQSFLNQPLKVRIPIIIENEGERESLRVDLAAAEDFRRVGLDRAALGLNLDVEVLEKGGNLSVLLSSSNPVRDPFLQVLVNADWSSGRLLRQYTLFLDPPLLEKPSIQVRNDPPPTPASRNASNSARSAAAGNRGAAGVAARPQINGESYGPVSAGETLWSIASRSNPNTRDYTVNQVMLAYVRLNPNAFDQGNVNSLRRGASLQVPAAADIAVVNAQEALRIVQQQHREWRPGFGGSNSTSSNSSNSNGNGAGNGKSDRNRNASTNSSAPGGRLQLVPPEESTAPFTNSAGLRSELARLEEELLTARLENRDLVQQVDNLRQQIVDLEGSGVQDRSLAEFQNYLGENRDNPDDRSGDSYVDPFVNQGFDNENGADLSGNGSDTTAGAGLDSATNAGQNPAAGEAGANAGEVGTDGQTPAGGNQNTPVTQHNTPPTVAIDQPPVASQAPARRESGFFSPLTISILAIGLLAVALLMWVQRRRDQQPGEGKSRSDSPGKSRFSAKNMLPKRKDTKDQGDGKDSKRAPKKGSAASLADRLIEASRQQQDNVSPIPGPAAAAVRPAQKPAATPVPPVAAEDEDFGFDSSFDEDSVLVPPPKPAALPPAPKPVVPAVMPEPVAEPEEDVVEEELDPGLDFILEDEPSEAGEDPTEALLRRLANEEEEEVAEAQKKEEEEDGLDFDLSGMEHLISSTGGEEETSEAEEEDPYEAVLRGMADDDDISAALLDEDLDGDAALAGPDEDEVEIKLDLARAYISMGDNDAASTILDEILSEGSDVQRAEARNLLKQI